MRAIVGRGCRYRNYRRPWRNAGSNGSSYKRYSTSYPYSDRLR